MAANDKAKSERILVVEDDRASRDLFTRLLAYEGYAVLTASDGAEGLERALVEGPDLVLLDLNLPRMDGLEVLRALQERRYNKPVILMTVFGSEEVIVEALRLGIRDYLAKPCSPEELYGAVERALAAGRLVEQRERLAQQEAALRAMQQLIVTVAHYVNNPLTEMALGTDALRGRIQDEDGLADDVVVQSTLALLETKIEEIAAVVRILQQPGALPSVDYLAGTPMFDIERYLQELLRGARG